MKTAYKIIAFIVTAILLWWSLKEIVEALPPLGKRWWAIIILSLALASLFTLIGIIKSFHERTVEQLGSKIKGLEERHSREIEETKKSAGSKYEQDVRFLQDQMKETLIQVKRPYETEIRGLKEQVKQLEQYKSQLEERDRYKLVPVIDVYRSSQVFLCHYPEHESSPPELDAPSELDAPLDHYSGRVNLRIWFENSDVKKGFMRGVKLSLIMIDHAGEEKEIHLFRPAISVMDEATARDVKWNQGLVVETTTPVYWITWSFDVLGVDFAAVTNDGNKLGLDCFIRLTMDAMGQPFKNDDFDVDWEAAEKGGTYDITPRN